MSKNKWALIAVVVCGLFLRLWGINFGLPFQFHQDEPIVVNHAIAYGTGDLNPHFFIIPPLCSYLLFFFYGIYFVFGKLLGIFGGTEEFALTFFSDSTVFYVIARLILGVIPGTLMVWMSYVLHKTFFGIKGALYTAALAAFSFLFVINAHYAYTDSVLMVFILAAYIFIGKLTQDPSLKNYLLSGIFIGLATGTKYNGILLMVSLYFAHLFTVFDKGLDKKNILFSMKLWCTAAIGMIIFVVTNPFSVLDWSAFYNTIAGGIRNNYMGWTYHISYSLAQGIGWSVLGVSTAGILMLFLREKIWKVSIFFSFPVIFYMHLVLKSQRFSRYAMPLIPFLAIAASFFIFHILLPKTRSKAQRAVVIFIAVLIMIPTTIKSVKADLLFAGEDTRNISTEWVKEHISSGSKISADHTSFRPQILQTKEQMLEKRKIAGFQQGMRSKKDKKIDLLMKSAEGQKTYNVYFLSNKPEKAGQFLSTVPALGYSIDELRRENIRYAVFNYNLLFDKKNKLIENVKMNGDLIAAFSPYYDKDIKGRYDIIDTTFMPIGSKEVFSRRMTGPSLVIYKLRPES